MHLNLLPFLQCPVCAHNPLALRTTNDGPTIDHGTLHCPRCDHSVAIHDGIVDMLGDAPVAVTPAQLTNYAPPTAWAYERLWRWQALSQLTGEHFPWRRELALVRGVIAPERGGLFVDVACSAGLYARAWATSATADTVLVGVDHALPMLREAQRQAVHSRQPISWVRAAAQALPFRAGAAAGVGMGGSLNEIGDAPQALREIRRILTPNGRFVTMNIVAARSGWGRVLQRLLATGGIAFPTLDAFNGMLQEARLARWAQWQWRVVAITAASPAPQMDADGHRSG